MDQNQDTLPTPSPRRKIVEQTIAAVAGLVALPIIALALLAVAATSRGNPLLSQIRLGRNEQEFRIYKIRTMVSGTPNVGTHDAAENWVTPVGKVLRATKIDELPQLWNVARGEMALVGPRPGLPNQQDLRQARREAGVFALCPGITGLAQVAGYDMSKPHRLAAIESAYAGHATLERNIRILVATVLPSSMRPGILDATQKMLIEDVREKN